MSEQGKRFTVDDDSLVYDGKKLIAVATSPGAGARIAAALDAEEMRREGLTRLAVGFQSPIQVSPAVSVWCSHPETCDIHGHTS